MLHAGSFFNRPNQPRRALRLSATRHKISNINTRTLIATDQDRAAVRSHIEKRQLNADGSYDLYFGPKAPAGREGMWIKTITGKGWWGAFRIYGPTASAFDGTWKLDDIVEMK